MKIKSNYIVKGQFRDVDNGFVIEKKNAFKKIIKKVIVFLLLLL